MEMEETNLSGNNNNDMPTTIGGYGYTYIEKTEKEKMECNECEQKIVRKVRNGKYKSIGKTYLVTDFATQESMPFDKNPPGRNGFILLCADCFDTYYRKSVEDKNGYAHKARKVLARYLDGEEIDFGLVG
jgi:DNA-directed RNA polymerase subunit RPC12/RpoP